jgi:Tol biopolymer transport system component
MLKVIPAAGGEALELLRAHQSDEYVSTISLPAWMPDSRQIIYARNVAGQKRQFELWRVSAGGGEPQTLGLTMQGLQPYGLSVHPDGRRIAFTAGKPSHSEVWVLKDFLPELKTAKSGVK